MSISVSSRLVPRLVLTLALIAINIMVMDGVTGLVIRHVTGEVPLIMTTGQDPRSIFKLWNMSDAGLAPIVFLGNSEIREGVAPEQFDQQVQTLSGQPVTSLTISWLGAVTTISRDMLKHLIIPRGAHTIFYGVAMDALKSGSSLSEGWYSRYLESPLGYTLSRPPGLEQSVLMWLIRYSTLFQYRNNLRNWLTGQPSDNSIGNIDERGHQTLPGVRNLDKSFLQQLVPFETDATLVNALSDILDACQQPGMRCVLLNMPMQAMYDEIVPKDDDAQYRKIIFKMAQQAGVPIWDFNTPDCRTYLGGDTAFWDLNHLNSAGAQKFTERLAALYTQNYLNNLGDPSAASITPCPAGSTT